MVYIKRIRVFFTYTKIHTNTTKYIILMTSSTLNKEGLKGVIFTLDQQSNALDEQIKAKDQTIKQAKELIDKLPTTKFYQSDNQDGYLLVYTSAYKAFGDQVSDSDVDWDVEQQLNGYDYDSHIFIDDDECNQCGTFQCPLVGKDFEDTKYSKILKDKTASLEAKNAVVMEAYQKCHEHYNNYGIVLKRGYLEDFYEGINIDITKFASELKPEPKYNTKTLYRNTNSPISIVNDLLYRIHYLKKVLKQKIYYIHYLMDVCKEFDTKIKKKYYASHWFINDYFAIESWLDEFKYIPGWRRSQLFISKFNPDRCNDSNPGSNTRWQTKRSMGSLLKFCRYVGQENSNLKSEEIWNAVKKLYHANQEYIANNLVFGLWVLATIKKHLAKGEYKYSSYLVLFGGLSVQCSDEGKLLYQRIKGLFCTPATLKSK